MTNALVSIIVPIFNSDEFLEETLSSIQNQSYDNIQVLLIDDASTDNSPKIIKKYVNSDPRFQAFYNDVNGGVSKATNVGLFNANGKYITFHDHDDVMMPNKISSCVDILEKDTNYDGVISIGEYVSLNGESLGITNALPDYIISCPYFVRAFERSYIPTWAMFLRSTLLNELRFDDEIRIGNQDFDFFLKLLYERPCFYYFPKPLIKFRQVPWSLSNLSKKSTVEIYRKHKDIDISWLYKEAGYSEGIINFALAKINLWRGDNIAALDYILTALQNIDEIQNKEYNIIRFTHATCLYLNQQYESCLEILNILKNESYKAEVLNNQGVCLGLAGDFITANNLFKSALSIFPEYKDSIDNYKNSLKHLPDKNWKYTKFPLRNVYKNNI